MTRLSEKDTSWFRSCDADDADVTRLSTMIFVGLFVLAVTATLVYGGVDTFSVGLLSIAAAFIFCAWIADAWRTGEFRFSTNILQVPLCALIVLGAFQLLPLGDPGLPQEVLSVPATNAFSLDPFATRIFIARLFVYAIFFAAALTYINSNGRARRLAVGIIIFGSVLAFFAILQRLADPEAIYGLRPTPQAIPFGPFVNQHHFAAFMEMTAGIVFALLLGSGLKRERKMFLLIAAALTSIALIFTGSRGGVFSFAGVLAFVVAATYFLRGGSRSPETRPDAASTRNFAVVVTGAAFALLIVGLVFYLGGGDSMLRGFGIQQMQTDVSSGRIHYWKVAVEIFKAHPIIGAGLEAFGNAFTRYDTLSGAFRVEQAHNDYLQMLADGGIVGFLCVTVFVGLLFRNGIRTITSTCDELGRNIAIGALAGCFGIAIHSFFDFPLRTPSNALFFLLLAALATTRYSKKTA